MTETETPAELTPEQELLEKMDAGFPPEWRAAAEGDYIVGAFLRLETGPTQFGPAPILILGTADGERSVWIFYDSLKNGLRRAAPEPGEVLAIRYMGVKPVKNPTAGRKKEFHDYRVGVDRPAQQTRPVDWETALNGSSGIRSGDPEPDLEEVPF